LITIAPPRPAAATANPAVFISPEFINAIIKNVTSIANVAQLPVAGGVILVIISMLLTLIAGLIPARLAAKKDPVVALRSE